MSKKNKPILHFCAYVCYNGQHGNAEVLHPPIRTYEDVKAVEARIADLVSKTTAFTMSRGIPMNPKVTLLNWRRFDE